ncbi:MAG: 50S ribosomal protein L1 [Gemmatimonadota bacterium]
MPKHGKKYQAAVATLEAGERLSPAAALERVKEMAFAGFDETVEAAIRLGVDPRRADQVVRATVVLPHGTGKSVRVLALARGEKVREAEESGADYAGADYIEKIEEGWLDFDVAVVTPDLMKEVARLGRILGPRGLMPNPKAGTVTMEIGQAVRDAKGGKIEFRVDRTGNVHAPIGKASFSVEQLEENLEALVDAILRNRPSGAKGRFVRGIAVSSTMGPGVKVDENAYRR